MTRLRTRLRQFLKSKESEKVIKNIFWLLQGRFLNYLVSFLVGIYTIKRLGPENYGLFAYCYAFTSLFITLSGFGIREIIIRDLVKNNDSKESILNAGFSLMFALSLASITINLILVYFLNHGDKQILQINVILCVALIFVPLNVFGYLFDSILESKKVIRISNLALVVTGLLKIVSVTFFSNLNYYSLATITENVVTGIGLIILYKRSYSGKIRLTWAKKTVVPLLRDSWPLALSSIAIWLYMRIDQVMIKQLSTNKESGLYAAGVRLVEMLYVIPMVIQSSFLPKLVALLKEDKNAFLVQLQKLFRIVCILSYILVIVYFFSIGWVVTIFLGSKYGATITVCRLLIFVFPLVAVGVIRGVYIFTLNITKVQLKITIISCLLNILLNFFFIPRYGAIGCVISILATQFFSAYLSNYLFKELKETIRPINRAIFLLK